MDRLSRAVILALAMLAGWHAGALAQAPAKLIGTTGGADSAYEAFDPDAAVGAGLPAQANNASKCLTTDGTALAWGDCGRAGVTISKALSSTVGAAAVTWDPGDATWAILDHPSNTGEISGWFMIPAKGARANARNTLFEQGCYVARSNSNGWTFAPVIRGNAESCQANQAVEIWAIAASDTGAATPLSNATPAPLAGAGGAGNSSSASRGDHIHPAIALSGKTPLIESGNGNAGTGTLPSRDDHVHPAPTPPTVPGSDSTTPRRSTGAGSPGSAKVWSRGDHVHPEPLPPLQTTGKPLVASGTGAIGTGTTVSRADHVHPLQPAAGLSDATPKPTGTAAAGTGTKASRDDHVHASAGGDAPLTYSFRPITGALHIYPLQDDEYAWRVIVRVSGDGTGADTAPLFIARDLLGTTARRFSVESYNPAQSNLGTDTKNITITASIPLTSAPNHGSIRVNDLQGDATTSLIVHGVKVTGSVDVQPTADRLAPVATLPALPGTPPIAYGTVAATAADIYQVSRVVTSEAHAQQATWRQLTNTRFDGCHDRLFVAGADTGDWIYAIGLNEFWRKVEASRWSAYNPFASGQAWFNSNPSFGAHIYEVADRDDALAEHTLLAGDIVVETDDCKVWAALTVTAADAAHYGPVWRSYTAKARDALLSDFDPKGEGSGTPGTGLTASRADHVHPSRFGNPSGLDDDTPIAIPVVDDDGDTAWFPLETDDASVNAIFRVASTQKAGDVAVRGDGSNEIVEFKTPHDAVLSGLPAITGQGGKCLKVNSGATGFELADCGGGGGGSSAITITKVAEMTLDARRNTAASVTITDGRGACEKAAFVLVRYTQNIDAALITLKPDSRNQLAGNRRFDAAKFQGGSGIVMATAFCYGSGRNAQNATYQLTRTTNTLANAGEYTFWLITLGGSSPSGPAIPAPTPQGKLKHLRVNAAGAAYELADPPAGPRALATAKPLAPGIAAVGTSALVARQDHVHPEAASVSFDLPASKSDMYVWNATISPANFDALHKVLAAGGQMAVTYELTFTGDPPNDFHLKYAWPFTYSSRNGLDPATANDNCGYTWLHASGPFLTALAAPSGVLASQPTMNYAMGMQTLRIGDCKNRTGTRSSGIVATVRSFGGNIIDTVPAAWTFKILVGAKP